MLDISFETSHYGRDGFINPGLILVERYRPIVLELLFLEEHFCSYTTYMKVKSGSQQLHGGHCFLTCGRDRCSDTFLLYC